MAGEVETFAFRFFGRTQAQRELEAVEENCRDEAGPQNRGANSPQLRDQLVNHHIFAGNGREDGVVDPALTTECRICNDSGPDGTHDAANAVHAEDVERVVIFQLVLHDRYEEVADSRCDEAEKDRRHRCCKSTCRCNRDQTCNRTCHRAEKRRLAVVQLFNDAPGDSRCGGGDKGVHEGEGCDTVRFKVRTGVETEPAHPEKRSADHGHGQAVRRRSFFAKAHALADDEAADQASDTGVDMDNGAACEIERSFTPEETYIRRCIDEEVGSSPVPHHVRDREIGESQPQHREDHQRCELDAFGEGTDDQRGRDAGKGHLENDEGIFRNIHIVAERRRVGRRADACEKRLGEAADERTAAGEGKAIAIGYPDKRRDRNDHEHLHQQAEHILGADKAAVEERECGDRHQQDQRGADQHPCGVALVDHRRHLLDCRSLDGTFGNCGSRCRGTIGYCFGSLLCKGGQSSEQCRPPPRL